MNGELCQLCRYGEFELNEPDEDAKYKFYYYECNFCFERFSTTLSDEYSLKKYYNRE